MYKALSRKFVRAVTLGATLFVIGIALILQTMVQETTNGSASPSPISDTVATASPTAKENLSPSEEPYVSEKASSPSARISPSKSSTPTPTVVPSNPPKFPREKARVVKVVDGDTIELEDGRKVRYIGIDTPETVKPNTPVQCMGKEASLANKELVQGKEVEMEKDVSETDRYGRLLRYVYVGDVMVNQYLVSEGYAYSSSYPPDVKYQEIFREAQRQAQESEKGLWGRCEVSSDTQSNYVLGASTTPAATFTYASATADSSARATPFGSSEMGSPPCLIKGNISTNGERIFHLPTCGSYEKTTINETYGERWFCTEKEAIDSGWRKAKNC